jgi:hypothetical protein
MELVIEGLDKLIFRTYHGRKIGNIHIDTRGRYSNAKSYVFTFPPIGNGLEGWDKELEVYLCKYPSNQGGYELFVMGLHGITCYYLEREHIKDIDIFHNYMVSTMFKAKTYWESL